MKTKCRRDHGFTWIEAVIVLATIAVLAGMLLPALSRPKVQSSRINCVNHLKQIGIGFRLYATDNNGKFPEFNEAHEAWNYFQPVGPEIGSPRVLICPRDDERPKGRTPLDFEDTGSTNNFAHPLHRNAALSYFYGADADESNPNTLLAGDRNISTNAQILTGVLMMRSNAPVQWTKEIHNGRGNVVLADGSAHQVISQQFQEKLGAVTNEYQRLVLP